MKRRTRQISQSLGFLLIFSVVIIGTISWSFPPNGFCQAQQTTLPPRILHQRNFEAYMSHRGPKDPDHIAHMRELIEFAKANRRKALDYCAQHQPPIPPQACSEGVPFCALIVNRRTDLVVAKACNQRTVNPIFHGEIVAITDFSATLQSQGIPLRDIAGYYDLYTTGEPCAMCMGAIMWAGFHTVFFGSSIDYLNKYFSQILIGSGELSGLWRECQAETDIVRTQLVGGVLEEQTNALFDAFGYQFCQ